MYSEFRTNKLRGNLALTLPKLAWTCASRHPHSTSLWPSRVSRTFRTGSILGASGTSEASPLPSCRKLRSAQSSHAELHENDTCIHLKWLNLRTMVDDPCNTLNDIWTKWATVDMVLASCVCFAKCKFDLGGVLLKSRSKILVSSSCLVIEGSREDPW